MATIDVKGTGIGIKPTPVVASFSGRGPKWLNPEILKPKLIAPRVNILAAWTSVVGQTGCAAALIKSVHLDWCPAVIRSTMMTTASIINNKNQSMIDEAIRKTFIRTTTDVSEANSIYIANIVAPKGVTVRVEQAKLVFTPTVKKRSFLVIVTADSKHLVVDDVGAVFGSLS
ncbi:hypothetical protein Golob_027173 [Gossypium lobatum]|uniref:Subtilisin-like protease fibronectin type-III domain-containing protein n=1 Tax=Gossypium lobatum TaxID=34289 RepID=A0A7J8LXF9_9ROSI|nr:hypothetical protein [Gossypium lobatum]